MKKKENLYLYCSYPESPPPLPERVFLNWGFVFHAAELNPALFADKEYLHVDMSAEVLDFKTKIRMTTCLVN